ncbi:MAG: hypothetical protein A3B96_02460 [Candidatus Spechtbacteria bacterium RIFCSPHIGHO2_02_FULL_43_15b]|uniref:Uncharacterized protein n=1 Tax=Candidatus Spechtbacteria bacterium RIFCSPHIGHO2_01_FULL_43_30 TaxID=1802158 RepID=A0A1G2H6J7_9BACT|nr:MAG: hypothetical protein A2827_02615 [Candidatus Spechtbacteria bacterium RIFCSPHIGHO2_01_FULL_43_30]OGZ60163.1 MAG: hypothetical protein A3B96_02460 [Candidatus Spechtbacteria bacterium RIFCSPHIGHO2_02_FULL_43_15b]
MLLYGHIHNFNAYQNANDNKFVTSISNKIALNAAISAGSRLVSMAFGLVSVSLVIRTLGQEGFGQYSTVLAYLALFVIAADLGLHSLMAREISRSERDLSAVSSNFFSLRFAGTVIFLALGFLLCFLFPYPIEVKMAIGLGSFGFLFLSMSQILLVVFQKYLTLHKAAIAEVLGRTVQVLFVYLIYIRFGDLNITTSENMSQGKVLYLFILVMSLASLTIFFFEFVFVRKTVKISLNFKFKEWYQILKVAWPIALSIALTLIYFKIDTIFLSVMKPPEHVGIYGAAYRVLESLIFFPAMFAGIMMPILSKEVTKSLKDFNNVLAKSLKAVSVFAFPTAVGGILLSYSIVSLIGGKEFLAAGLTMQILFIAIGLIFFGNILGRAVIALDLQKKATAAYLFGVVLNVALNIIFIPKYSYLGAAWTTVVTELMIVAFLFLLVKLKTDLKVKWGDLWKILGSCVVMGVFLYAFANPITEPLPLWKLGIAIVIGAVSYFGALYIIKGVDIKEISSIMNVKPPTS